MKNISKSLLKIDLLNVQCKITTTNTHTASHINAINLDFGFNILFYISLYIFWKTANFFFTLFLLRNIKFTAIHGNSAKIKYQFLFLYLSFCCFRCTIFKSCLYGYFVRYGNAAFSDWTTNNSFSTVSTVPSTKTISFQF